MFKLDIGIACWSVQYQKWWTELVTNLLKEQKRNVSIEHFLAVTSALPDFSKNNTVLDRPEYEAKRRSSLTDSNRGNIVESFLDGGSDWLWFIDDDTVPPDGALSHLLYLKRDFVAGLYFNPKPPHNPVAYTRLPDGLYRAYYGYTKGTLQQVDSVGMGCTLIHRSVFEKILDNYTLFQRHTGSLVAIYNDDILDTKGLELKGMPDQYVEHGYLHTRLTQLRQVEDDEEDNRAFPFYAMEYSRTEDHHFCEMCDRVGIKPWLDTTLICGHIKPQVMEEATYLAEWYKMREEAKI